MNKNKEIASALQEILINPEKSFEILLEVGMVYGLIAKDFVHNFPLEEVNKRSYQENDDQPLYVLLNWIYNFQQAKLECERLFQEHIDELIIVGMSKQELIFSLFYCAEHHSYNSNNVLGGAKLNYSKDSMVAINAAYQKIEASVTGINKLNNEIIQFVNRAFHYQKDIHLLKYIYDKLFYSNCEISVLEDGKEFLVSSQNEDEENFETSLKTNRLKELIKQQYEAKRAQEKVSQLNHFMKNDRDYKTHEGLPLIFTSGCKVLSISTSGVRSMEMPEHLMNSLTSENVVEKSTAKGHIEQIILDNNFHYRLRHVMASIFYPNDEIDISELELRLDQKVSFTVLDFLLAVSSLIAFSDNLRYQNELQGQFNNFGKSLSLSSLFEIFRDVEELKLKSDHELASIVTLISSKNDKLPVCLVYDLGQDQYYLPFKSLSGLYSDLDFGRIIYDYYISNFLFSSIGDKKKHNNRFDSIREKAVLKELEKAFKNYDSSVLINLDYNVETKFKGEGDLFAYFKKENILIAIELKLANATLRDEKGVRKWVESKIENKALIQIDNTLELLQDKNGLKWFSNKLGIEIQNSVFIYPIIVTDIFAIDHLVYNLNRLDEGVICISYFELKHLLNNQIVHENQERWTIRNGEKPAETLIGLIEDNSFWNFIKRDIEVMKVKKETTTSFNGYKFSIEL